MLFVPDVWLPGFLVLGALELSVPDVGRARVADAVASASHHGALRSVDADRAGRVDPGGERLPCSPRWRQARRSSDLVPIIVGGLLIVCSMWWIYFDRPVHDLLTSIRKAFIWGYGHYVVFASAAAVGAGLAVAVDAATHTAKIGPVGAGVAVAVPVATYLLSLWFLHDRPEYRQTRAYGLVTAVLVLLTPFTGHGVPLTGAILAGLVGLKLFVYRNHVRGSVH